MSDVQPNWENPDFKPDMELRQILGDYTHESAKVRRAKTTANQSYKAERASRLGSMAGQMGRSLVSNIITRIKGDN